MATIWSKYLPWTWFGYTPSILPRASPAALEDGGYAPSVPPELQVSLVKEDVRPLPQTVSYDIQSLGKYDVFLNHRGPDVKDTFVAHLNDALCAAGFHPFLDAKSLIKGEHAYKSINEALSGVGVHVAIFSKGYAESKYCLDELHDMLESGKLILPVFYGVEVEHLCRPYDGPFAAGLRQHKRRGRHQDVERWETALAKVADLQGFRLSEFNGDEAQLKRRIVLAVQRALPARRLQQVAPHRVGLEESLKIVIKKLNLMGDSVGVIGVFGMGGIGKTTLVREVYNHFAMEKRFEEQSFLKDVRSIPDPLDLQKQLVYDLLQEDLQSSEKFSYWFDRFMGRKVLIVVDDIDHRSQFNVLIPDIDKLARGSRILVTSRDQNVLSNIMRGDGHLTAMHEVELMSPHDSYQLFNWHAFYNEKASDGFQDLARKVADACCRLPLALEVIGAFLFDKKRPEDRDCWHQATETLRANGDILNQLKISYDGLSSDEARLMFKDIACFLIGKDEQMAMQIFESCNSYKGPQVSFHALMDKSLVTLDSDRRIRMHDLLRDMGRNVVTKQSQIEGQRSHLWDPAMAERVLRKNQGTDAVRGLSVAGAKDGAAWKAETYTRMSELHFLILDHCQVKGDFSTWSEELRWLQWWSLPLSELPPTLSLLNLSVLDLTGSKTVTRISPKNSNDEFLCKELRMLILKDCTALEELPQTIGKLSRLKNLDLQGCSTLKALPDSVGELVELMQLNLSNCRSLERLPDTIGFLSKLKKLWLTNCTKLKFLPTEFGKLQRLDEFWADATSLSRLPHSFSQLSNLEDLHLHKCEKIQELPSMSGLVKLKLLHMGHIGVQTLPEDFGHLQNLVDLHLYSCKNLQTLPQSFGLLQLQRLEMSDNHKLKMLPKGFGGLKSLVDLNISNNSFQQGALPSDFGCLSALTRLSRLKNLDLQGCSTLKALPNSVGELVELTQLNLSNCTTLERLPNTICLLSKLKKLWLINCTKLKFLPTEFGKLQRLDEFWADATSLSRLPHSFSQLSNLEDLHLHKCEKIQELPSMSGLVKLKLLHMGHIGVQTLPEDFGHLQNLVDLHLYSCKNLQTLPQSFGLLQLQRLEMSDNHKLKMLPKGFGGLKSLVDLNISNNSFQQGALPSDFGCLSALTRLSRLKNLDLQRCSTLKALPDSVGELVELTQLNLSNCTILERLPDTICLLSKLKKLWLINCTKLKFLPTEFGKLQRLDEFWADATSLSELPHSFSQLSNLEDLHLHKCEKIQELPSMNELVKLKLLHMGHIGVQTLPEDFGHLQNLVDLHLYSCKNLQTLPQSFGLLQLQRLEMSDNHKLKMLPKGFGGLKSLVDLNISNNSFQQGALPSDFGRLSALTRLQLQYNYMVSLPEGFKELQALVFLEMHHCPNLVDVQGLPWSLEYLDLGDCPKLIDIPSLRSLHSLKSLILCNCTSLTQLQDLDSLITLEKVNLSGCTMLQNVPNLNHNGGLKACYWSGSYISMLIDSDWLKVMKDPQAQNMGSGFVGPLGVPNKWDCQSSSQEEGFQSTYQKEASTNLEPDTSEGKNRNNQIHQFSQHGEGLGTYLDQVGHFVVTENGNFEEENLQKSLQHMLIGLQRHGEVAVTNLHQFHADCMGDSIFVATREVVEGVEFLFSDAQCMSRVVGVGLERAKVLVTRGYEVGVMQLSESDWKISWEKVFSQVKDSESSELVAIKMPKLQGDHVKSMSLPAEDISRKFGVSLKDFPETHVITLSCTEEQSGQFFPLVWKIVDEYRNLKCGSTCATTKQTSGTGSTKSPNTSSSGSIQQSTSGGGPNFSQSPSLTRQEEKMDDDEDDDESLPPEDPLPPDPSSAPNDMRNRTLKVSIFPGAGGAFHDPDTKQSVRQTPFQEEATIMPVIEIEFLQEGIDKKFITVTTQTQCNLGTDGGPEWRGVKLFSWYQNNINISFKGNDRQTQLLSSSASAQDDSLIDTKSTINKALMASTSYAQEESRGAGGQIRIAGSGVQGQIDIKATETQGGNLTIANTQEIGGIKQIQGFIVHPRCRENDLVFNFCLPSRLMPGSSTESGIDLQSLSQCDDTFDPKVTGKWNVWSENQHASYIFEVRRYLYRLPSSKLHQDEIKCLMQDYQLLMFVNLAMTHLDRYNTNDIVRLTERNPELPYVIKVTPGG